MHFSPSGPSPLSLMHNANCVFRCYVAFVLYIYNKARRVEFYTSVVVSYLFQSCLNSVIVYDNRIEVYLYNLISQRYNKLLKFSISKVLIMMIHFFVEPITTKLN